MKVFTDLKSKKVLISLNQIENNDIEIALQGENIIMLNRCIIVS